MIAEQKLKLIQQIVSLPDNLLQDLQGYIDGLVARKKATKQHGNGKKLMSEEDRLKIINEAAKHLTHKEDFEAYMRDFEESTQDRPLPFRED